MPKESFTVLSVVLAASVLAPPPPAAAAHPIGPPWIAIELPANPLDPTTRGALFLVRTYHHAGLVPRQVSCALEGVVDGDRRTVACRADTTAQRGVYAVRGDVPDRGVWMLVVSGGARHEFGTALVDFDAEGAVSGVRVPSRRDGSLRVPTRVSDREIDAMLRARWSALSHSAAPAGAMGLAGFGLLALVPLSGLLVAWRRRR